MDAWRETDEEMVTLQSKNVTSYTAREGLLLSLTQPLIIKKAYVVQKKPAAARPKNDNTSFSVQPAFSLVNDTVTRCYSGSLLRLDIYSGARALISATNGSYGEENRATIRSCIFSFPHTDIDMLCCQSHNLPPLRKKTITRGGKCRSRVCLRDKREARLGSNKADSVTLNR